MTKPVSKACLGASLLFLFLSDCASDSSDAKSSASSADAGSSHDASTQSNEVVDGAARTAAAEGGSGGAASTAGRDAAGGAGGSEPDEPMAGSGGSAGRAGFEPMPRTAGSGDDADAGEEPRDPNAICTSCGACEQTQAVVSAMHTNMPVSYPDPPPSSGPHNPCWASWGIHYEPLAAERWVHNLEHGGVVFLYNCPDGCADDVTLLENIVNAHGRTVMTVYDKLPTRFAVVSWGHRLLSDCLDEQAFAAFYDEHFDRAPESIADPPSPSCPP